MVWANGAVSPARLPRSVRGGGSLLEFCHSYAGAPLRRRGYAPWWIHSPPLFAGLWSLMRPVFGGDTIGWRARDPAVYARQLVSSRVPMPALFVDVGRDDPFLEQNRAFRADLTALGIPVKYAEWPGKHDWAYWRRHAAESLVWMAGVIAH